MTELSPELVEQLAEQLKPTPEQPWVGEWTPAEDQLLDPDGLPLPMPQTPEPAP